MLINVLGISSDLFEITKLAKKNNLTIIEDNYESLDSKLKNKYLGTFGILQVSHFIIHIK